MKKVMLCLSFAAMMAMGLSSCGGSTKSAESTEAVETTAVYTCPMHPEVQQAEPGECPICGMDLVEQNAE